MKGRRSVARRWLACLAFELAFDMMMYGFVVIFNNKHGH